MQESVSHAIQKIGFSINNLFQQQISKVIKPTKCLRSTIKITVKTASLFIY